MDKETEISVINDVKITQEGDVTHFSPIEENKEETQTDNRSWLGKLVDWWKGSKVKPYVKVRDLADPFGDRDDMDAGSDGKNGVEIGLRIDF